jgi:hypothetical protein
MGYFRRMPKQIEICPDFAGAVGYTIVVVSGNLAERLLDDFARLVA